MLHCLQEGWSAQVEVSSTKEALKENLHRYREQAEALLLVPFGTQPAEVSRRRGHAKLLLKPRVVVVVVGRGGGAVVMVVANVILVVAGVAIEVRPRMGSLTTSAKVDSGNADHAVPS